MGIQINGNTDIISATDGSLTIQGASGNLTGNLTGTATTAQGLTGTPNITVGTIGATSLNASGVVTATSFSGALTGNVTGNVTGNATGLSGTPNITVGNIIASSATISGNVSVAGTVTYEDVTNVDSVGLVTARTGVRIDAGGLVVVGVTTVAAGSAAAPSISPTGDSNTGIFFPSADTIAFGEGGVEALRINSSGNVGIGTDNPGYKLHIEGTGETALTIEGDAAPSNAGGLLILKNNNTTANSINQIQSADAGGQTTSAINFYNVDNGTNEGYMSFLTRPSGGVPTEAARFTSSGNLRFPSGQGIDFSATANSSGTMSSELLDDYEEGTWTPIATSSSGSITSYGSGGNYTKIGDTVRVNGYINITNQGSAGGQYLNSSGLPFTSSGGFTHIGVYREQSVNGFLGTAQIQDGSTTVNFLRYDNSGVIINGNFHFTVTYKTSS